MTRKNRKIKSLRKNNLKTDHHGRNIQENPPGSSRKDISHKVNTVAGSRLHRIIGEFAYTNSFHHQVIEEVGEALQVTGRTADGVIEAIEMPSHPFVLGVQWHPESMYEISSDMRYLFRAFMHFAEK